MKTAEQLQREEKMFGCDIEMFKKSVEESLTFKMVGLGMVLASLMSDAQEMIARDMKEDARQTLNKAKYLITEFKVCLKGEVISNG